MRGFRYASLLVVVLLLQPVGSRAQDNANSGTSNDPGFFENWFRRVDKTQAEQPHWATPLATTTPRLEEEFRYDILRQTNNAGITSESYGGAKGLELFPAERVGVILVAPPAYIAHNNPLVKDGFGDWASS